MGFGIYLACSVLVGGAGPEITGLLFNYTSWDHAYILLGVVVCSYVLAATLSYRMVATYEQDLVTRELFELGGDVTSEQITTTRKRLFYGAVAMLLACIVTLIALTFLLKPPANPAPETTR